MVAILTPPAVEPPPINMRMMESSLPPSEREPMSVVLNPAVRGVTAQKTELHSFPTGLMPANRRFPSIR